MILSRDLKEFFTTLRNAAAALHALQSPEFEKRCAKIAEGMEQMLALSTAEDSNARLRIGELFVNLVTIRYPELNGSYRLRNKTYIGAKVYTVYSVFCTNADPQRKFLCSRVAASESATALVQAINLLLAPRITSVDRPMLQVVNGDKV